MCKDNCANQCGTPFLLALNEECEVQELLELSDVTMENLMWYSENPSIVTINLYEGFIDACGVGCTRIYAVNQNGVAVYCTNITVSDNIHVSSIELDRDSVALEEETSTVLAATLYPYNATNKTLEWESSNTQVAQVVNGKVCALKQGTAVITVRAKDGSDKSANCNVTVTGDVLVTSVEIDPEEITLVKDSFWALNVTVNPENATNPTLLWHSDDESIAIVTPNEGVVHTQNIGTVRICAEAQDGSGVSGTCMINVIPPVAVSGICLCQTRTSVAINDERRSVANVIICPENATNTAVTWSSSNTSIAVVDAEGRVTGLAEGEVTITAKTKDGGYIASCDVTVTSALEVDTRERVMIAKDIYASTTTETYFNITFENSGLVWKNVGCDLSDSVNRSGCPLWLDELENQGEFEGDDLNDQSNENTLAYNINEQRYLHNEKIKYSVEQLAFIYMFDPLGVAYYVKSCEKTQGLTSVLGQLKFKDILYEEIFCDKSIGEGVGFFNVVNDQVYSIDPTTVDDTNRRYVYSHAELIFGAHALTGDKTLFVWAAKTLTKILVFVLKEIAMSIIKADLGVDPPQGLYYAKAVNGSDPGGYIEGYLSHDSSGSLLSMFGWIGKILNLLNQLGEIFADTFVPLNPNDVVIYRKVNENNRYQVQFAYGFSLDDIVTIAEENMN